MRMFDLTAKVAVVVGGTSGLGKAVALGLAEAGADVIASSRSQTSVQEVARLLEARGSRTLRVLSDVTNRESLQVLHDRVIEAFGAVHILVNAAGITKRVPTLKCSEDLWTSIMTSISTEHFAHARSSAEQCLHRYMGASSTWLPSQHLLLSMGLRPSAPARPRLVL